DLVAWFKSREGKYQTRINAVLREYVERHPHGNG
ncbi:MAG: BrnA antitoxin family protein, partial [Gammaproteobacteria bacterium]|nr:BrnA antitoxin family protein [Gammaproteobacteria bacterium]